MNSEHRVPSFSTPDPDPAPDLATAPAPVPVSSAADKMRHLKSSLHLMMMHLLYWLC